MKRIERKAITVEMNISRRNLFVLGGGAVTAALVARPENLHAGSDGFAVMAEPQRGKVKIRDVQSASIADVFGVRPSSPLFCTAMAGSSAG